LTYRMRLIESSQNSIEAAFQFAGLFFCMWLGVASLLSPEIPISKYVGFF